MGTSIGFAFLEKYYNEATRITEPSFTIKHHIIANANIWLPLSTLSTLQLALLDNTTGYKVERLLLPAVWAASLRSLYNPPLSIEELAQVADTFRYKQGTLVQNEVIQYLQQRACYEEQWLAALNE